MSGISEDVLRQAREAVEPIKGMVQGESSPGHTGFAPENSSRNLLSDAPQVVDSFDTQLARAVAQEKALERGMEREMEQQRGRDI